MNGLHYKSRDVKDTTNARKGLDKDHVRYRNSNLNAPQKRHCYFTIGMRVSTHDYG